MSQSQCPSQAELIGFILGTSPDDRAEEILDHIEACPTCGETVVDIESSGDTIVHQLQRKNSAYSGESEAEYSEAIRLAIEIGRDPSFSAQQQHSAQVPLGSDELDMIRDYRLLAKLGEGGMGTVYKALHTQLDKVVAVKVLPTVRMKDEGAVSRFRREMKAVGRLEHRNIVRATDAGQHEGTHYLVMEHVQGKDLSTLVNRSGPFPVADACEVICQAAIGLQHAYDHKLVHRDIKPSNLMLTPEGTVKILDLGLALLHESLGDQNAGITTTGQVMGTFDYMAPEQSDNSHAVDIRADVYALGATLYKLLTGKPPLSGKKYDTLLKKLTALANEQPIPIGELRPDVPAELSEAISQMLAKDPKERFATPAEVAESIGPYATESNLRQLLTADSCRAAGTTASENPSTDSHLSSPHTRTQITRSLASEGRAEAPPLPTLNEGTPTFWSRPRNLAIAVSAMAAIVLLGVILTIRTPTGSLRIEIDEEYGDRIKVVVEGNGRTVTLSEESGWEINLSKGTYKLALNGSPHRLALSEREITVTDGDTKVVKISISEDLRAANSTESNGETAAKIDLLALVDPVRDSIHGEWKLVDGVLTSPKIEAAQIDFPVIPPDEYSLELIVERLDESDAIECGLVLRGMRFSLVADHSRGERSVLTTLDDDKDATYLGVAVPSRKRVALTYVVKKDRIQFLVDGEVLIDWKVELHRFRKLKSKSRPPVDDILFLAAWNVCRIHEARLTTISGKPKTLVTPTEPRFSSRYLTEALLLRGAVMEIRTEANQELTIDRLERLPRGPFSVIALKLAGVDVSGGFAQRLTQFTELKKLSIQYSNIDRDVGEILKSFGPSLDELEVSGVEISSEDANGLLQLNGLKRLVYGPRQFSTTFEEELKARLPGCDLVKKSPDRYAAEFLLAKFSHMRYHPYASNVKLTTGDGESLTVTDYDALPAQEFKVHTLGFPQLTKVDDSYLHIVQDLDELVKVFLWATDVRDEGLMQLRNLPRLEEVQVSWNPITDAGVRHLIGFPSIRRLSFAHTPCTGSVFASLSQLPKLEFLYLNAIKVKDEDLKHLVDLPNLQQLEICVVNLTDAAVPTFAKMNSLTDLHIIDTKITEDGVARLRQQLPNCRIKY